MGCASLCQRNMAARDAYWQTLLPSMKGKQCLAKWCVCACSLSVCLCVCVCLSVCLSLSVSVCLCLSLSVSVCLSVCLSLSLSLSVSLSFFLFFSLCLDSCHCSSLWGRYVRAGKRQSQWTLLRPTCVPTHASSRSTLCVLGQRMCTEVFVQSALCRSVAPWNQLTLDQPLFSHWLSSSSHICVCACISLPCNGVYTPPLFCLVCIVSCAFICPDSKL